MRTRAKLLWAAIALAALALIGAPSAAFAAEVPAPAAPRWSDPCGPNNLDPKVYDSPTVDYTVTKYSTGKVKVVAAPTPGNTFPAGAVTQWQKLDSGTACIILEPNTYIQHDECGTANDRFELVRGSTGQTGQSNWVSWVHYAHPELGFVSYAQTGGAYAFAGVTPDINGVYSVTVEFPPYTNEPCPPIVVPTPLPEPTQNADGTFALPEVEGVFYGIYEYEDETIVVASTYGHPGYVLEGDQTYYEWHFPKLAE